MCDLTNAAISHFPIGISKVIYIAGYYETCPITWDSYDYYFLRNVLYLLAPSLHCTADMVA